MLQESYCHRNLLRALSISCYETGLAGQFLFSLKQLTVQKQASAAAHDVPFLQLKDEGLEDTDPWVWGSQDLECLMHIHLYTHFHPPSVWGSADI